MAALSPGITPGLRGSVVFVSFGGEGGRAHAAAKAARPKRWPPPGVLKASVQLQKKVIIYANH